MKDTETKHRFIELRAKGHSYDNIAHELDVSKPTLLAWGAELSKEISEAKIIELDAILEQFELMKVARVKSLVTFLKKVETELEKRDLSNVSTEKLLEMLLTLRSKILEEVNSLSRVYEFGGDAIQDIFKVETVRITALD